MVMKLGLIFLLALCFSLSGITGAEARGIENELRIDSIVNSDSVKYFIFTSSDEEHSYPGVNRRWYEETQDYVYYLSDLYHYNTVFSTQENVSAIVKPKSFLKTISTADWDVLSKTMNRDESNKMRYFFIHECHEWKRKSGKETKLYFIDRNDFSGDTIKIYRVCCRSARYYINEIIDELEY